MNTFDEVTQKMKQKSLENILFALEIINQAEDVTWSVLDSIDCDALDRLHLLGVMIRLEGIMMTTIQGNFRLEVRQSIEDVQKRLNQLMHAPAWGAGASVGQKVIHLGYPTEKGVSSR